MLSIVALLASGASAQAQQSSESSATAIAFQPFQHGYMLWRQDQNRIFVAYTDIVTKSGAPCQEVYRDTFDGQPLSIPAPPPGLFVPTLGFGWLYQQDPQLAAKLGYATADEVSRVASANTTTGADGGMVTELAPNEPIDGQPSVLRLAGTDEPGLTYCFPRASENRAVVNTWTSRQLFEHGAMVWRQDMPDRIEVWHLDTQLAPELGCADLVLDSWRPGMDLAYGDLAVPDKRLPVRGFGKIWLEREKVRQSLGYPISDEEGGFAELSYEPFKHPTRGNLLIRRMIVHLAAGDWKSSVTIPNATSPADDHILSTACESILIPHQH
jgi:hypothetical protein